VPVNGGFDGFAHLIQQLAKPHSSNSKSQSKTLKKPAVKVPTTKTVSTKEATAATAKAKAINTASGSAKRTRDSLGLESGEETEATTPPPKKKGRLRKEKPPIEEPLSSEVVIQDEQLLCEVVKDTQAQGSLSEDGGPQAPVFSSI
jgi:hypothetical protein